MNWRGATTVVLSLFAMAAMAADFTQARLEEMVKELSAHLPQHPDYVYPIKCSIEENEEINAYATVEEIEGSEKLQAVMVVFTGLVENFKGDEKMIRAVVAHELAHLSKGHPTMGGFKVDDVEKVFIRQIELEADAVGAACLAAAGYSKDDMIRVLLKLDELGKDVPLMHQIGADHPTGANRASVVADNPLVYRSLADFQLGNAMMENRQYPQAIAAYTRAIAKEPNFGEAYLNLGQAQLMDYYDKLPQSVKEAWFRPDFGPVVRDTPLGSRNIEITNADRNRYTRAVEALNAALVKSPSSSRAKELKALAQVMDPDGAGATLSAGIATFRELMASSMTDADTLRLSNNLAIGLQRQSDVSGAVAAMMTAQKKTATFNRYLAENLGQKGFAYVTDADMALALGIVYAWLQNTPESHDRWGDMKAKYLTTCAEKKFEARDVKALPTYLCQATTINVRGKEISFQDPVMDVVALFGKATKGWSFAEEYPDMMELRWDTEQFHVLGDGDRVYRVTSYDPGSFIVLKPRNDTVRTEFKVTVGMSVDEFNRILNLENADTVSLVRSGSVEEWQYFPGLLLGVCIDDDKIVGITVTP